MFYFHFQDGTVILDHDGIDLADMTAVRAEAVATVADRLRDGDLGPLLDGKPFRLWVTDRPAGEGKTLFALNITTSDAD